MTKILHFPNADVVLPRVEACPSCGQDRPFATGDASFAPGSVCPTCGHVETDAEREPLQYHFVVWAEIRDGKAVWSIDFESAILGDGSVFDPSEGWNTGWRILNDDEIGLDTELCIELERRLNVPNPRP